MMEPQMKINAMCLCGGCLPFEGSRAATVVVDRSCRRCGARYRIVARPHPISAGVAHFLSLTCTRSAKKRLEHGVSR